MLACWAEAATLERPNSAAGRSAARRRGQFLYFMSVFLPKMATRGRALDPCGTKEMPLSLMQQAFRNREPICRVAYTGLLPGALPCRSRDATATGAGRVPGPPF